LLLTPRPPRPPLFPYTTLFRSGTGPPSRIVGPSLNAARQVAQSNHGSRDDEAWNWPTSRGEVVESCYGRVAWPRVDYQSSSSTKDRKSTRLNSSHLGISYAVFC